ncbi:hypothetical protein GDO81_000997 [Engystomops pustulosus]|uniref:Fibronectin type-III domain-containing protein n=1 Tax=Engystomops pustulosus TaxID=76066 RepID=A0AAV7DAC7_ENGPU|nr:hypothetical protein GDO81_000997 [Engystomops pustulosus]
MSSPTEEPRDLAMLPAGETVGVAPWIMPGPWMAMGPVLTITVDGAFTWVTARGLAAEEEEVFGDPDHTSRPWSSGALLQGELDTLSWLQVVQALWQVRPLDRPAGNKYLPSGVVLGGEAIATLLIEEPDHAGEQCEFALDGHQSHYFQIRQTYKEGVWSEWSEPIFVPAEIGPVQIVNLTTSRSNISGIRTISLHWKPHTKEEGNMNYHINVSFLHCCNVTTSHLSEYNWFQANISRAAYNVTVIASNQVQSASPWSTVIEEDWAAIPFQNVTLSGNNLTIKWKGEKAGKSSYCIVWKTRETKGEIYIELVGNNNVTILTDNFLPMKCYRIHIHKISKSQITLGTTYYLKPSSSIGPRNLTVINVTVDSILLKWDAFDLYECQEILQNWVITREDHATNVSKLSYANSSVTQYLVEGLPLGFNYTFEVKGITIFGEKTGSSFKSVSSPWTGNPHNVKYPAQF